MSAQVISLLDRPTYTYPQVDRLLELSKGTANRWLNGYRRTGKNYEPILRTERSATRWVTWGEFVETRLLANYRDVDEIPTLRMRKAVEFLRAELGVEYPLARGALYLQPFGRELLVKAQAMAELSDEFVVVTATNQVTLAPWVHQLVEIADTGDNDLQDVMRLRVDTEFPDVHFDPRRRGGQPTVGESNVLAATVAEFVSAGEPEAEVGNWYHLTPKQVDQAIRYTRIHAPAA